MQIMLEQRGEKKKSQIHMMQHNLEDVSSFIRHKHRDQCNEGGSSALAIVLCTRE